MMSKKVLIKAIEVLESLASGSDKFIVNYQHGICYNLDKAILGMEWSACGYVLVSEFSEGWEHHTGNLINPVPSDRSTNKWTNDLRLDLCKYMANKINKEFF